MEAMTLRTKVAEALRAELKRQELNPTPAIPYRPKVRDGASRAELRIEGSIDLEALADAALEARKRWHRATDPSAK